MNSAEARRKILDSATLIFGLSSLPLAFAQSLGLALACTFVAGGGWVATLTSLNVAMQLRSPEDILGRCLSIYQAVTFGGMALGAWCGGLAGDA